jgi:hypothetical protein
MSAVSDSAPNIDPNDETVWPAHSFAKSGWRRRSLRYENTTVPLSGRNDASIRVYRRIKRGERAGWNYQLSAISCQPVWGGSGAASGVEVALYARKVVMVERLRTFIS